MTGSFIEFIKLSFWLLCFFEEKKCQHYFIMQSFQAQYLFVFFFLLCKGAFIRSIFSSNSLQNSALHLSKHLLNCTHQMSLTTHLNSHIWVWNRCRWKVWGEIKGQFDHLIRVGENFLFLSDIGSDKNWGSVWPMAFVSVPPFFFFFVILYITCQILFFIQNWMQDYNVPIFMIIKQLN